MPVKYLKAYQRIWVEGIRMSTKSLSWTSAVLVCAIMTACTSGSSTPGDTTASASARSIKVDFDAARAAVLNRDSLWIRSVQAKNIDSLMTLYAPDAESMQEGVPAVKGTEALRAIYAGFFKAMPRDFNVKLKGVDLSDDGTLAYDRGSFTATVNGPGGKPLKVSGDYLNVWKKIDGRWVTVAEMSNSSPPPKQ